MKKLTLKAMKALSYTNISVKKNYKIHRKLLDIINYKSKLFSLTNDYEILLKDRSIPIRIFSPNKDLNLPVLIFFHGGGWVTGNTKSYDSVCDYMAKTTNHRVISVDYRLAPEHPFPNGLNDCYEVVKWAFNNIESFYINKEDITLIGDSAGASLAAGVSLMARDNKELKINKQILIYPLTQNNHNEDSPFLSVKENKNASILTPKRINEYIELYKSSNDDLKHPYFAPLFAKNLKHQPKTLIITAQYDPLRDEGIEYGKALEKANNKVEIYCIKNAIHGFFNLSSNSLEIKKTYHYINNFLGDK